MSTSNISTLASIYRISTANTKPDTNPNHNPNSTNPNPKP